MIELKALFKLSPSMAIKHFKNKNNKLSWDWHEVWQSAHQKTFTVAKLVKEDVLQDIRDALDKALADGQTFQQFQKELKPTLQKKGWWGEQFVGDSEGNIEHVQMGSLSRLKTIYQVNMQTSYMVGRYRTQLDNADNRPYWQYVAVMDKRTRPEHAELNERTFRYDDPFWDSFYPPNGWRCRCRVRALSKDDLNDSTADSSKGQLSQEMQLVSKKTGEMKPVTIYTDPLTNHKIAPDVGWSYNPGKENGF
ncbi:MAG: phage minor head protein [bacterium]